MDCELRLTGDRKDGEYLFDGLFDGWSTQEFGRPLPVGLFSGRDAREFERKFGPEWGRVGCSSSRSGEEEKRCSSHGTKYVEGRTECPWCWVLRRRTSLSVLSEEKDEEDRVCCAHEDDSV